MASIETSACLAENEAERVKSVIESRAEYITLFTESHVEEAALHWFQELGYTVLNGPDIAPGQPSTERASFADVVLVDRLRRALKTLNPDLPPGALDDACRKLTHPANPNQVENNCNLHRMLTDGVKVAYKNSDGRTGSDKAYAIDFSDPGRNDWLAVNQFTIIENRNNRRPDIIVFLNGLPIAVIELKSPADSNATVKQAFQQVQTYKQQIPCLFQFNALLVISDGLSAKVGALTSDREWYQPWRTIDGAKPPPDITELEVLIRGVFDRDHLLDLIQNFIVFEIDGPKISKKIAAYHQYHAVNKAVTATLRATSPSGNRRIGVIWHTQGSGKSISMAFYAGKIIRHPAMQNPTVIVLTDRNDLDNQLFGTFACCEDLLRQTPSRVSSRTDLRTQLQRASGGVVFTTVQKFAPEERGDIMPLLSDRRNIVVIADEAHRSQYGFEARVSTTNETAEVTYGFAKYLRDAIPNAAFIGFTGTPIELSDKNTVAVFGECIDIYDIQQSVADNATVPIYYEGRLARLELNEEERPRIDPDFEEVTEGEETSVKEQLKRKWAQIEAMVGTPKRIGLIARDLAPHFEARQDAMRGKGMIVCMSRRICVDLYNDLIKLRPDWHSTDDATGNLKVVMTGSASDGPDWQSHIRSMQKRKAIARRFKDPHDPLQIVIVRDMWLTGFDVPCLHTMYVDKPMKGHTLMQAIARVNRVYGDKPGGLIVDYIGIADQLKYALAAYTQSDRDQAGIPIEQAVALMQEKLEVVHAMMHGFDDSQFRTGSPAERLNTLLAAQNHVLTLENGKQRFVQTVADLGRAFALAVPHDSAIAARDQVGFFQAVRAGLIKTDGGDDAHDTEDLNAAVRQIVAKAVTSNEVIDIFTAAGLDRPEISILSDEFLTEVQGIPYKNLAIEALKKLLADAIKTYARTNLVQSRQFSQMLEETIKRLQNRSLETAAILAELVELAKQMREAGSRGEHLGLTDDELAFYDALEVNDSAVKILGDDTLRDIARELVVSVRKSITIDWNVKESTQAAMRVLVKRILRKHGYPPDKQEKATATVLEQTKLLCEKWA